jgi:hypothetical protein
MFGYWSSNAQIASDYCIWILCFRILIWISEITMIDAKLELICMLKCKDAKSKITMLNVFVTHYTVQTNRFINLWCLEWWKIRLKALVSSCSLRMRSDGRDWIIRKLRHATLGISIALWTSNNQTLPQQEYLQIYSVQLFIGNSSPAHN